MIGLYTVSHATGNNNNQVCICIGHLYPNFSNMEKICVLEPVEKNNLKIAFFEISCYIECYIEKLTHIQRIMSISAELIFMEIIVEKSRVVGL